jgi:hypothetical protein
VAEDWTGRLRQVLRTPNTPIRFQKHAQTDRDGQVSLVLSFDEGYHQSGWWANADYERCFHLSVAMLSEGEERVTMPEQYGGGWMLRRKMETPSDAEVWAWAVLVFGAEHARMTWTEPAAPPGDKYRLPNVVHVRLFLDENLVPFMPLGEVYHLKPTAESPAKILDGRMGADVR